MEWNLDDAQAQAQARVVRLDPWEVDLANFFRLLPQKFSYRYTNDVRNAICKRLLVGCGAASPPYQSLFFPNGLPLKDDLWSLKEAQGVVDGAEYTEAARGTACGHIFRPGEASYHCRSCTNDPTCVFCARCFDASDHEGHSVYIHASDGNSGCCDCGDDEAWSRPVHCGIHSAQSSACCSSNPMSASAEAGQQLPDELLLMIRSTISTCLDYLCDVWSCSPEQLRASKSPESIILDEQNSRLAPDVYGGPDLTGANGADGKIEYALILWNDEKHTVTDVRNSLERACRISANQGTRLADQIDQLGRTVVKYSHDLDILTDAASILEQPKLSVTIRSSRDNFREQMCAAIVEWMMDLSGSTVGIDGKVLKHIICEELIKEWRVGSRAHHKMVGQDGLYDHDREEVAKELEEVLGMYGQNLIARLEAAWGPASQAEDQLDDDGDEDSDQHSQNDLDDMLLDDSSDIVDASLPPLSIIPRSERAIDVELSDETDGHDTLLAVPRTSASRTKKAPKPPAYWRQLPRACHPAKHVPIEENLRERVRLDWLILYDLRMWKHLRINLREIFITTLITIPKFKRILALRFASVFTVLAELHLIADREPDHSLICLSLQLLTVPSITVEVIERGNFLTNLMAIIYTFLSTRQVGYPHQVNLTSTLAIDQGVVYNRRAQTFYHDMRHMLALSVVRDKIRLEPRYLLQFLDIAKIHQGICPNTRATGDHVEYEMESWMSLSTVMNEVMRLCRSFAEAFQLQSPQFTPHLTNAIRTAAAVTILNSLGTEMARFEHGEIKHLAEFHTCQPFEFDQPNASPYEIVKFVVAQDPMSCYHSLHYLLSWLINEANPLSTATLLNLLTFTEDELRDFVTSKNVLAQLSLTRTTPGRNILVLFDYPIRVCAWMAQSKAGMWVRNGLSLRHQIQQYRGIGRREFTHQRDIFLVQTAFAICNPAAILATVIDRFDLIDWVRGNYQGHPHREESQTIDIAEDFIHLLIVVLSDRLNLTVGDRDAVAELATRRELIHALCCRPMSYNELRKYLTERVKDADDQEILQQVANFKAPEGMTDHGTFILKEEYFGTVDPYLPFLSRNQREEVESAYRTYMANKTGKDPADVIYEANITPLTTGAFKNVHLFTETPLFAQVIFYFIQYAMMAPTYATDIQSTKIEQLFQFVLHLTLIAINLDDEAGPESPHEAGSMDLDPEDTRADESSALSSFSFMVLEKKASKIVSNNTIAGLLRRSIDLEHLKSCAPRVRRILQRLQQKRPLEYRRWMSTLDAPMDFDKTSSAIDQSAKDLKKKQALERQARVMAQFRQQQASFVKNQNVNWDEDMDDLSDDDLTVTDQETTVKYPTGSCILCQEETNDRKIFGTFGLIMESRIFRTTKENDMALIDEVLETPENLDEELQTRPFGMASKNRKIVTKVTADGNNFVHAEKQDLAQGFPCNQNDPTPVSTGCGHLMHFTCYEVYIRATQRRHQQQIARHHPEDVDRNQFLCPLCKALGNVFLPILWKPQPLVYPGILGQQATSDRSRWIDESFEIRYEEDDPYQDHVSDNGWFDYAKGRFTTTLSNQFSESLRTRTSPSPPFKLPLLPGMAFIEENQIFNSQDLIFANSRESPVITSRLGLMESRTSAESIIAYVELKKVYKRLTDSLNVATLPHPLSQDHGDFGTWKVLLSAITGTFRSTEIAQRGIASPRHSTFIENINSQTITHLRVLSETILSFRCVMHPLPSSTSSSLGESPQDRIKHITSSMFIEAHDDESHEQWQTTSSWSCPEDCKHDEWEPLLSQDPFDILVELAYYHDSEIDADLLDFIHILYLSQIVRVIWAFTWQRYQSTPSKFKTPDQNYVISSYWERSEAKLDFSDINMPPAFIQLINRITSRLPADLLSARYIQTLYILCQRYALTFIRSVFLLLHIRYGIDYPAPQQTGDELTRLSTLLHLPSFDDLLTTALSTPVSTDRIFSWISHLLFSTRGDGISIELHHPAPFELIGLPKNFDTLQDEVMRRKCPTTQRPLYDPAICLFCGEIFCSQSVCCTKLELEEEESTTKKSVGGCWQHRVKCGGPVGMFLHIRKCTIVLLHGNSGCFQVAPYLDKFGEADPSLRTKLQLFLNQKRYDAIFKNAWLNHGIPSVIARRLEGELNTGGWESL